MFTTICFYQTPDPISLRGFSKIKSTVNFKIDHTNADVAAHQSIKYVFHSYLLLPRAILIFKICPTAIQI